MVLHDIYDFSFVDKGFLSPLQASRSIGGTYLKKAEFKGEPLLLPKFRLLEPFFKPILV